LRKAEAGSGTEAEQQLLRLLRELARAGTVFCPISESVFMELMKQEDSQSRLRTAQLIDDLSFGISLIPYDMRAATELAHFIHSRGYEASALHPLRHLIWSKLSYVLGTVHPSSKLFDPETGLAIQKAFFDEMWSMSLVDVVKTIGTATPPDNSALINLAARLNTGNAQHTDEVRSFIQAYAAESRGAVSVFGDTVMNIVSDIAAKHKNPFPSRGSNEWNEQQRRWRNLLFLALQGEEARQELPSIHIMTCLHAVFRWDKSRRFQANDFYDFFHASAALAFCQAFFTERSLRSVITANHLGLDKLYGCRVVADVSEAIDYLGTLNLPSTAALKTSDV
jgi:hypothetical protein